MLVMRVSLDVVGMQMLVSCVDVSMIEEDDGEASTLSAVKASNDENEVYGRCSYAA